MPLDHLLKCDQGMTEGYDIEWFRMVSNDDDVACVEWIQGSRVVTTGILQEGIDVSQHISDPPDPEIRASLSRILTHIPRDESFR